MYMEKWWEGEEKSPVKSFKCHSIFWSVYWRFMVLGWVLRTAFFHVEGPKLFPSRAPGWDDVGWCCPSRCVHQGADIWQCWQMLTDTAPDRIMEKKNVSIYRRRQSMIEKLRTFFFHNYFFFHNSVGDCMSIDSQFECILRGNIEL